MVTYYCLNSTPAHISQNISMRKHCCSVHDDKTPLGSDSLEHVSENVWLHVWNSDRTVRPLGQPSTKHAEKDGTS